MRGSSGDIKIEEKQRVLKALYQTASRFVGKNAVESFLNHALTDDEKLAIGRRIAIAQMILAGLTYYEINERLHVSPNTFSRINKWVHERLPGYAASLKQERERSLKRTTKPKRYRRRMADPLSFQGLKDRYPMHFLLFNIADSLITKLRR